MKRKINAKKKSDFVLIDGNLFAIRIYNKCFDFVNWLTKSLECISTIV